MPKGHRMPGDYVGSTATSLTGGRFTSKDQNILLQAGSWRPPLVTSGLVMHLDAGNPASYSGSGTTWTDLTGNGNNASLSTSAVYSSSNGGTMIFNGTSGQYATTPYVNQACSNSTLQTWSCWIIGSDGMAFGSSANSYGQFHMGVFNGTSLNFNWSYYGGAGGDTQGIATVTPKAVNHIAVVKTAAYYYDVYYNGVKVINQNYKNATTNTNMYFGTYYSGSYSASNVPIYQIYNRALTSAEVLQNYESTRSRFGV